MQTIDKRCYNKKRLQGRGIYDPFFKLSLKPRAKDLNGSKNHPKGLGASFSGGTYAAVLGRTVGLSVSGSSRFRLRLGKAPDGADSGAITVSSVEAGDRENWRGKATELTLSLRALSIDLQQSITISQQYAERRG